MLKSQTESVSSVTIFEMLETNILSLIIKAVSKFGQKKEVVSAALSVIQFFTMG